MEIGEVIKKVIRTANSAPLEFYKFPVVFVERLFFDGFVKFHAVGGGVMKAGKPASEPQGWEPGIYAVEVERANVWVAIGGNAKNGANHWARIVPTWAIELPEEMAAGIGARVR